MIQPIRNSVVNRLQISDTGVLSLNGEAGNVTLTSSGNTIAITTPTSSTINLEATNTTPPGGSNGQVQYNNAGSFGGLTNTQLTALINAFSSSLSGAVPASGGGTANFLRADGSWAAPPGGGPGGTSGQLQFNNAGAFGGTSISWTAASNLLSAADFNFKLTSGSGSFNLFDSSGNYVLSMGAGYADFTGSGIFGDYFQVTGTCTLGNFESNSTLTSTLQIQTSGATDVAFPLALNTRRTSGSVSAGFGNKLKFNAQYGGSGVAADIGDVSCVWTDVSSLSALKAYMALKIRNGSSSTLLEGLRIQSDGSYALTSIGGAAVAASTTLLVTAPASTFVGQTIQLASSQSANAFQVKASSGTVLSQITSYGGFVFPGGASGTSYIPYSDGTIYLRHVTKFDATPIFPTQIIMGGGTSAVGGAWLSVASSNPSNSPLTLAGASSQTAKMLQFYGISSTSTYRSQADIDTVWVDSTDATRKARVVHYVYDTAAREALRIEASGSAAMLGFFGTSAVVQQSGNIATGLVNLGLFSSATLPVGSITGASLFDHYADASNGGTAETDLYSDTLSAGKLASNGDKLILQYGGTFAGDATSTQRLKAYFGGTQIFDSGALGVGVSTTYWDLYITLIRESSSIVRCSATLNTSFASLSAYAMYTKVTGLTLANTQVMKITGTAAGVTGASNQVTASEGYVEYKIAA